MSYLELLKLASPEAIVVITALVVLTIGLTTGREAAGATVSTARPTGNAGSRSSTGSAALCGCVAVLGLAVAIGAVLMLPSKATPLGGMLVNTPVTSLFRMICIVRALFRIRL